MPTRIPRPTQILSAGNKPKMIQEYIGRVNSKTTSLSIACMQRPSGWVEPGHTPEFDEYTIVLKGMLRVTSKKEVVDVYAGEAFLHFLEPTV